MKTLIYPKIKKILVPNVLIYLAFSISVILMVVLALKNDGSANDDHIEVAKIIFKTGKIPEPRACWQCYHPKLYHYTVAKLWSLLGIYRSENQILLAQLINAITGIITLTVILSFIRKQPFKGYVKLLAFSFIALNPRFIAIHAQPSNDALIILFGTLMLHMLYKVMSKPKTLHFILLIVFSVLAGLTKSSSAILIIGVGIVFCIKIISDKNYSLLLRRGYLGWLMLLGLSTVICIGIFGEYYKNYKTYGKPVVYNTPVGDIPHLFKETTFRRAGVKSIIGGYFSFRIIDMIKNPVINNDRNSYPLHRTSVWSQLYGRTHFLYFDDWPRGVWSKTNPAIRAIGRVALALALLPTALFLLGLYKDLKIWPIAFVKNKYDFLKSDYGWIFHVFFFGFVGFIILFTLKGRDFSFMKIIYLFPGILGITIPLLKGFELAHNQISGKRILSVVFNTTIIVLWVCYLIPILYLIFQLGHMQS